MVLAKYATINSREWREMKDYHPEGYPFRATLVENQNDYWNSRDYEIVPIEEINEQLKAWRIGFKYEAERGRYAPGVRAYFFKTARELMRMRLTFAEHISETYQCKPRSQIEAERRRDARKKRKKDRTIMLSDAQLKAAYVTKDEDEDEDS